MHRARLLLLTVPLLLAACGDDGDDPTIEEPSTTAATAPETQPPTTPPPPIPQADAQALVTQLLDAWQAGDQGSAYLLADAAAVTTLFAIPPEAPQPRGCNEPGANVNITCVYRISAGELQVRAAPRGDGYVVDFVFLGGA